ncbi:hypothetical protein SCLCIDRAFT_440364 [Scleroderma citrinum Foug A]|uniref:Uncharacterized protein n=1 Tax=Scleroderma citrinum Foug A TaxID=1036808 RepID=A0A0C3ECG3_9AGAM|nr:hypothetical protein SCLCIDRAFT_440364 [Scleroderma citrinum Foug A]
MLIFGIHTYVALVNMRSKSCTGQIFKCLPSFRSTWSGQVLSAADDHVCKGLAPAFFIHIYILLTP